MLFALMPICLPRILYLIDEWLERCKIDLKSRGASLEIHIKQTLSRTLSRKLYQFHICPISNLQAGPNDREEIDLIINFKNVVLVAEIKCIKYPMEARDYHNATKRLKEGAVQIQRKAQFLMVNKNLLNKWVGDIDDKEIISVVITNYPLFSGQNLEGIPIIDFLIMDAYADAGRITDMKANFATGVFDTQTKTEEVFYTSEDEFGANLKRHFEFPLAVERLRNQYTIKKTPIVSNENFRLYAETAIFD